MLVDASNKNNRKKSGTVIVVVRMGKGNKIESF